MPWNDNSGNGDEPPKANGGPWGSGGSGGGGNGNGGSPWGRPGSGGGGSDIEEQMRKMQERFSRRGRGGGGGGGRRGPSLGPGGFLVLGVVALVAWLATGIVIVDEGERAAVFRFGQYQKKFHTWFPRPSASTDRDT